MWLILIHILLFLLVVLISGSRIRQPTHSWAFFLGMVFKVCAGLGLGYYYWEVTGTGDTLFFFEEAREAASLAKKSFTDYLRYLSTQQFPEHMGESRNEAFIKIISLILLLTGGSYWITACWLSLLSFFVYWYFFRTVSRHQPALFYPFLIGLLFLPSGVLWSSGLMKDTLTNSALIFLIAIAYKYFYSLSFKKWEWVVTFLSLWILLNIKFYLAGLMVIALILLFFYEILIKHLMGRLKKVLVIVSLVVVSFLLVSGLNWNLHLKNFPTAVYENHQVIKALSDPDKRMSLSVEPTWTSLIIHAPIAFVYGLSRPLPWEGSYLNLIFGIENLLLILFLLVNIYSLARQKWDFRIPFIFWLSIGYFIMMMTILPLVSPNFGSLVRYKAAFTPLLFSLILIIPFHFYQSKKGLNP